MATIEELAEQLDKLSLLDAAKLSKLLQETADLTDLQRPWRRIRARAGLEDVRIHDLRHSFASAAVANGESLPMIGKLLGHKSVKTTARYAHLADEPVQAAAGRVAALIFSPQVTGK